MSKANQSSVLIVEDVPEMREHLREFCQKVEGVQAVYVASNGWEARMELLRNRPKMVLLDEVLPVGESARDLISVFHLEGIEVVLITGMESPSHALPPNVLGRLRKPGWDGRTEEKFAQALQVFLNRLN